MPDVWYAGNYFLLFPQDLYNNVDAMDIVNNEVRRNCFETIRSTIQEKSINLFVRSNDPPFCGEFYHINMPREFDHAR